MQDGFEWVIWRSLRNAPPIEDLLVDLIQGLSQQQEIQLPERLDGKIRRLIQYLRTYRCLLLLDNAESVLQSGDRTGRYQPGYEGYGQLLRCVGESAHSSCIILTSREQPKGLSALEGETLPVRCFHLTGLTPVQGQEIFQAKGQFIGSSEDWRALTERYAGNPLALKIVASAIRDLVEGRLADFLVFLQHGPFIFDDYPRPASPSVLSAASARAGNHVLARHQSRTHFLTHATNRFLRKSAYQSSMAVTSFPTE